MRPVSYSGIDSLILGIGTVAGRAVIDAGLQAFGAAPLPWERFGGGFDTLVAGTAPVFWLFFLGTGIATLRLRRLEPERPRPFRIPLYPWTPLAYAVTAVAVAAASAVESPGRAALGIGIVASGIPVYFAMRRASSRTVS